jgi:hypothetical protein
VLHLVTRLRWLKMVKKRSISLMKTTPVVMVSPECTASVLSVGSIVLNSAREVVLDARRQLYSRQQSDGLHCRH